MGVRWLSVLSVTAVTLAACGGGGDDGGDGLKGSEKADQIVGTEDADTIEALGGDDSVEGRGGDDKINGGEGKDFLYGGAGDDHFVNGEDDAVDVHDCGPGSDLVENLDTRDEIQPSCEKAGWTAKPPTDEAYENSVAVVPQVDGSTVTFEVECAAACDGALELRTPRDRKLLGESAFKAPGPVTATLNKEGKELIGRGGYVRVVIRSGGINSGFTTFIQR